MGIGIFNKLKRFGRGFISGIKDIFNDPKVKDAVTNGVNGAKNDIVNVVNVARNDIVNGVTNVAKNEIVNVAKNAVKTDILDKNKLLKGLTPETIDNIKDVVSFASRKWIPKFKN